MAQRQHPRIGLTLSREKFDYQDAVLERKGGPNMSILRAFAKPNRPSTDFTAKKFDYQDAVLGRIFISPRQCTSRTKQQHQRPRISFIGARLSGCSREAENCDICTLNRPILLISLPKEIPIIRMLCWAASFRHSNARGMRGQATTHSARLTRNSIIGIEAKAQTYVDIARHFAFGFIAALKYG